MSNLIFNFTNTYSLDAYQGFEVIDLSELNGTDMYVDEAAQEIISQEIASRGASGIHLIDSGNYHYMTRLFTQHITEPYILVFFDNHTDMKPAMFDMLSCGSWAKACLEKDVNLKQLVMLGPPEKSIGEIDEELSRDSKLRMIPGMACDVDSPPMRRLLEELEIVKDLPVYFSIDKDILSKSEVETNWDQGEVTMEQLISIIQFLAKGRRVIGADICGLLPMKDVLAGQSQKDADPAIKGLLTDKRLIEELWQIIYQ